MFRYSRINVPLVAGSGVHKVSIRNFAENPRFIAKKIASTKSIQKITKSMKMVSAAKLRGDTNRLMDGRTFGRGFTQIMAPKVAEEEKPLQFKSPLYVAITSDRGLCGGVNSFVAKKVKAAIDEDKAAGRTPMVMVVGDKGVPVLQRGYGEYITGTFAEPWKTPVNFSKMMAIAERVAAVAVAEKHDVVRIVYNKFVNSIKYDTSFKDVPTFPLFVASESSEGEKELPVPLNRYEVEYDSTEEAVSNIFEYGLAVQMYGCALESATSEQSSRMTAMDNASKNAKEMVQSLTVKFNRARQAKITTELTEIISGAESLKG